MSIRYNIQSHGGQEGVENTGTLKVKNVTMKEWEADGQTQQYMEHLNYKEHMFVKF